MSHEDDQMPPGGRRDYDPWPRTRWTDDRLDDFWQEFREVKVLASRVPVIEEQLKGIQEDTSVCRKNIHNLRNDIAATAAQQAAERKTDRRWVIGTIVASAGIIVAAMNVLLGHV